MTADEPLYRLSGVGREYRRGGVVVRALRDVSLDVGHGELVSIEGPSGSGKSTLLQLLGALDVATSGHVVFEGEELATSSDRRLTAIRSQQIGFVFQQFNLIPTLTAVENVAIAMATNHLSRSDRKARATELLERVGLGQRLEHLPSRMSGGEQQRVAIARALANRPRVIIADEPTGNLDSESAAELMALLVQLRTDEGVTIIVATHDADVARYADRRVRLRDGRLASDLAA